MTTDSECIIRQAIWPDDRHAVYAVRHRVFVQEQGVPEEIEQDALDAEADHALMLDATGRPVATGRLLPDGHIGRVAVLPEWRGRGLGRRIMEYLTELAGRRGLERIELNAQLDALGFYEALGYEPVGETFIEAGIVHQAMRLALERAARIPVTDPESACAAFVELLSVSRRQVLMHLPVVHPRIWGDARLLQVLRQRVIREHRLTLRLITPPVRDWRRGCAGLLTLMDRRPGAFDLRTPGPALARDRPEHGQVFAVGDGRRVLRLLDPLRFAGDWCRVGSPAARDLGQIFEELWRQCEPDPDQRTMRL